MTFVDHTVGTRSPGFDPTTLNAARIYDFWLGGKDNFAVDRRAARQVVAYAPEIPRLARQNREFLGRVVRYLAGAGIRQFIDIGTGLPTQGHVHEVLQTTTSDARVAYVDHDPVVLAHARALLKDSDRVTVVDGDLRQPDGILSDPKLLKLIDMDRPVAVLLLAVLHLVGDDEEAMDAVARLCAAMAPGSYLAISHAVCDPEDQSEGIAKILQLYRDGPMRNSPRRILRSEDEVRAFFANCDMELVAPGLVELSAWRPEFANLAAAATSIWSVGGIARKR